MRMRLLGMAVIALAGVLRPAAAQSGDVIAIASVHSNGATDGFQFDNGRLIYSITMVTNQLPATTTTVFSPTAEEWSTFWQEVDSSGAWEWRESYGDSAIYTPGLRSSTRVTLEHDGRRVAMTAYNRVPPSYPLFDKALVHLMRVVKHAGRAQIQKS